MATVYPKSPTAILRWNRMVFWSTHSTDWRPLPWLLLPTNGPRYGSSLSWRYCLAYGSETWNRLENPRSVPYLTSAQVIGEPSSHFRPCLRVNSQVLLLSLGRPVSVA